VPYVLLSCAPTWQTCKLKNLYSASCTTHEHGSRCLRLAYERVPRSLQVLTAYGTPADSVRHYVQVKRLGHNLHPLHFGVQLCGIMLFMMSSIACAYPQLTTTSHICWCQHLLPPSVSWPACSAVHRSCFAMTHLPLVMYQDQLRDDPLCSLRLPVLFVRGTNDPFSSADAFHDVHSRMSSGSLQVHHMEGGDHSLKVKGGQDKCKEAMDVAYSTIEPFLLSLDRHPPTGARARGQGASEHDMDVGGSARPTKRIKNLSKTQGAGAKQGGGVHGGSKRKGRASAGGGAAHASHKSPTRTKKRKAG
jgi:hypothetical protein